MTIERCAWVAILLAGGLVWAQDDGGSEHSQTLEAIRQSKIGIDRAIMDSTQQMPNALPIRIELRMESGPVWAADLLDRRREASVQVNAVGGNPTACTSQKLSKCEAAERHQVLDAARINMREAVKLAALKVQGAAYRITLSMTDGTPVYEMDIVTPTNQFRHVLVNAVDGRVWQPRG